MNDEPEPTVLVRRSIRLQRQQWERATHLVERAGISRTDTFVQIFELGANAFEHSLSGDGGQQQ